MARAVPLHRGHPRRPGYTAGIIGFCSGTGDMLELVRAYTRARPGNPLARFLPALRRVNGTASHAGWDGGSSPPGGVPAKTRAFRRAQDRERDRAYFGPAVSLAKSDGVRALGQFAYYDIAPDGDEPVPAIAAAPPARQYSQLA